MWNSGYLLFREAPASEIIGLYTSAEGAMAMAERYESDPIVWDAEISPGHFRSGLWRIFKLRVEDGG